MELVERYVYAVTQKLPEQKRKEVEKELRELIDAQLKKRAKNGKLKYQDVEAVLTELGDPNCFAAKYKGNRTYFIGPELLDTYFTVLKIVGMSILIALSILYAIDLAVSPMSIVERLSGFLVSLITGGVQVFGWITIVFALLNYAGPSSTQFVRGSKEKWTPLQLQPIPDPKKRIKPIEPTVGIIFAVLMMVLLMFYRDEIGIHIVASEHSRNIIPLLNEAGLSEILPFIYLLLGLGILKEFIKWISREWTFKLFAFLLICNLAAVIVAKEVFANPGLWNQDLLNSLVNIGVILPEDEVFSIVSTIWTTFTENMFLFILAGFILDTIMMIFKIIQVKIMSREKTVDHQG